MLPVRILVFCCMISVLLTVIVKAQISPDSNRKSLVVKTFSYSGGTGVFSSTASSWTVLPRNPIYSYYDLYRNYSELKQTKESTLKGDNDRLFTTFNPEISGDQGSYRMRMETVFGLPVFDTTHVYTPKHGSSHRQVPSDNVFYRTAAFIFTRSVEYSQPNAYSQTEESRVEKLSRHPFK